MDKIRIPGLKKGRGSFVQVSKQIYTKLIEYQIRHIAKRTFGKMMIVNMYYNLLSSIANGFFDAFEINES